MSYTGVFKPLQPLDRAGSDQPGVRILDLEGFEEYQEMQAMAENAILGTRTYGEYPPDEYRILYGFDSSSGETEVYDEQTELVIHNYGVEYSVEDDFLWFWESVSEYTEPFWCYHSPKSGGFPDLWYVHEWDYPGFMYRIEARDGDVSLEKVHVCGGEDGDGDE